MQAGCECNVVIATCPQGDLESTFLRCDNVAFTTLPQPKHNVVTTLSQRDFVCWVVCSKTAPLTVGSSDALNRHFSVFLHFILATPSSKYYCCLLLTSAFCSIRKRFVDKGIQCNAILYLMGNDKRNLLRIFNLPQMLSNLCNKH